MEISSMQYRQLKKCSNIFSYIRLEPQYKPDG